MEDSRAAPRRTEPVLGTFAASVSCQAVGGPVRCGAVRRGVRLNASSMQSNAKDGLAWAGPRHLPTPRRLEFKERRTSETLSALPLAS